MTEEAEEMEVAAEETSEEAEVPLYLFPLKSTLSSS